MRSDARNVLLACLALWGCGGEGAPTKPPGPAVFADATTEASVPDAATDTTNDAWLDVAADFGADSPHDTLDDTLVADASDAIADALDCVEGKTCVGAPLPTWQLQDFQPKSPRYLNTYGLEGFKPKVTVVALLSGW